MSKLDFKCVNKYQKCVTFINKANCDIFLVAANKIYKEHLECLTVRDEQFSREMLADIFTRLATLPPSISTETLAK